jgi:hypothetical protein
MNLLSDSRIDLHFLTGKAHLEKKSASDNWVNYYFKGVPPIAAVTILTSFQNNVRNAYAEVEHYNYMEAIKK